MNANMDQYRAWQNGGTVWVKDLADATFYARRVDAEAVHLDDDAAWRVVRKPLPDGGEAVHGQVECDRSRDYPKDNPSGPTGEVGGVVDELEGVIADLESSGWARAPGCIKTLKRVAASLEAQND